MLTEHALSNQSLDGIDVLCVFPFLAGGFCFPCPPDSYYYSIQITVCLLTEVTIICYKYVHIAYLYQYGKWCILSYKGDDLMGKTSSAVKNRYNAKAYDQLPIRIPKGQKATVQAAAEAARESVNQYTQRALLARMGLDDWPELSQDTPEE